jgi:FkbM family methyltransferase
MLEVKKHDFPNAVIQDERSWMKDWHGNGRMRECLGERFESMIYERESNAIAKGIIPERIFERYAIASIIETIKTRNAVFMEVGAGYGEWCLAFDGLVKNKAVSTNAKTTFCIGVEPDPVHCEWLKTHFAYNEIKGMVIEAVVSDVDGFVKINRNSKPDYDYGQTIVNHGIDKRTALGLLQYMLRNTMNVKSYKLDDIMWEMTDKHIDLVHIDVQGAEDKVIKGASELIFNDNIDYLIIGTHGERKHDKVKKMLGYDYDFVVDIKPNSIGETSIGKVECQDGILICERKDI